MRRALHNESKWSKSSFKHLGDTIEEFYGLELESSASVVARRLLAENLLSTASWQWITTLSVCERY